LQSIIAALRGKVVWITGSSSGIGKHLAITLGKQGVKLVLSARNVSELEKVKLQCISACNVFFYYYFYKVYFLMDLKKKTFQLKLEVFSAIWML
jgi:short chain dehydrogenase